MSSPVPVSSIPTISDLYKNGSLQPSPSDSTEHSLPTSSSALNSKISLIRTSITTLATTSIVNAANTSLLGGGGVDGAIHSAAGPSLYDECKTLNGCQTGHAKITSAHELPCSYIIHAVGPIYHREGKISPSRPAELLRSCYCTSLDLAAEKGGSIAFSCLSTGVYGYPPREAAEVASKEVRRWLEEEEQNKGEGKGRLERVVFCCFEAKDERAYEKWLPKVFPPSPEELPTQEKPKEAEEAASTEAGAVGLPTNAEEPASKKLKTDSEDLDKDWEAVEKPSEAASEKGTEISEEGEKVEAPDLSKDDGEKIEKPSEKNPLDAAAETGEAVPRNALANDW
ncbi:hypothetical protein P7C71_g4684, partial [Lecanoromycetidae sp. Uapishka_2]